jgi:nicotinamide-nucleotide amidase
MRNLLQHEVLPRLASRGAGPVIRSRTVRTTGIPESALAERLGDIEARIAPLTLAYLPGTPGVDLRATAWGMEPGEADLALSHAAALLRKLAGEFSYGEESEDLAAMVLARARDRGLTLATAESCTGGLIGGRVTDIPGSSEVYLGGVVAYHNSVKMASLDVAQSLIDEHGAVSEPVAGAMAIGVATRLGADLALSVTGIAGPSGGTADKPVGTVCFGIAVQGKLTTARAIFPGSRAEIRERATQSGLFRLWKALGPGVD